MARTRLDDMMQAYPFWLVDIDPSQVPPFFVLNPLLGFATCSGVSYGVDVKEHRPLNSMYSKHLPEAASVDPVTMTTGARFNRGDFARWVGRFIAGTDRVRRNLLLVHFMGAGVSADLDLDLEAINISAPFSEGVRVPGRAWVLWGCLPTRYSGGAFDASSGDVVIMELEVQPHHVTEVALGEIV